MNDLTVIIMAAGEGTRMGPGPPKVVREINGLPMIVGVVESAYVLRPARILVVVGRHEHTIHKTLATHFDMNKMAIKLVRQKEPQGTGDAIRSCLDYLRNETTEKVIVLSADMPLLSPYTMHEMMNSFRALTIVTTNLEDPTGYGRIVLHGAFFHAIVEQKDCDVIHAEINQVNCGVYAFRASDLHKYIPKLNTNNKQSEYYLTDVVKLIADNEIIEVDIVRIPRSRQWEVAGVNTPEQLMELAKLKVRRYSEDVRL